VEPEALLAARGAAFHGRQHATVYRTAALRRPVVTAALSSGAGIGGRARP
jgi:hypothetical protein